LSGQETRRLARAIEEARSPAEKYSLTQDRLSKALAKGGIDQATYNRLLDAAKTKQDAANRSLENSATAHAKNNTAMQYGIGKLKGLAAAYIGVELLTKSISLAIDAEQAAASFEVLTGSVEDSTRLLEDLRRFSDVTPLSTSGVRDAARTMLGFNVPLEDVMDNLKMLGDITGGNEQRFNSLTLAFSQVSAAGRLMGQDVNQMIDAGFNPLQEISRKTGESLVDLKKRMEDGAISSLEVRDAFVSATGEGGKFNGMTEKLADTMGGRLAIAMGDLEKAGTKLGQTFEPLVISLTDLFDAGISKVSVLLDLVEKLVDGIRFVGASAADMKGAVNGVFTLDPETAAKFEAKPLQNIDKLLFEIDAREKKRMQELEDAAWIRMAPATRDPSSPQYKARVEAERKAAEASKERSAGVSVGVLASAVGEAIAANGDAFQPKDLLVPTPGEQLIADSVDKAVEAIRDNQFTRIR